MAIVRQCTQWHHTTVRSCVFAERFWSARRFLRLTHSPCPEASRHLAEATRQAHTAAQQLQRATVAQLRGGWPGHRKRGEGLSPWSREGQEVWTGGSSTGSFLVRLSTSVHVMTLARPRTRARGGDPGGSLALLPHKKRIPRHHPACERQGCVQGGELGRRQLSAPRQAGYRCTAALSRAAGENNLRAGGARLRPRGCTNAPVKHHGTSEVL